MLRLLWIHANRDMKHAENGGRRHRVPHREVECAAMVERSINFHNTGNPAVVSTDTMNDAHCGLSIVHDGNACFNHLLLEMEKDSVLNQNYPVLRLHRFPKRPFSSSLTLASRTAHVYTYGEVQYKVSTSFFITLARIHTRAPGLLLLVRTGLGAQQSPWQPLRRPHAQ